MLRDYEELNETDSFAHSGSKLKRENRLAQLATQEAAFDGNRPDADPLVQGPANSRGNDTPKRLQLETVSW
jgi:hypothetical protein